ncbi:MAG: DEAD/DEAH box helicase [Bacteriovoracaceae bacterium]
MDLRPYQKDCIKSIRAALLKDERALVYAPTAFGKTIVFSSLIGSVLQKEKKIKFLIIVPRVNLVIQTVEKLIHFMPKDDIGVYCATYKRKELDRLVTVSSYQSLLNLKETIFFNGVIVDEVHKGDIERISKLISYKKIIGFAATPFDSRGNPIYGPDKFFKELAYNDKSISDLTKEGYLCPVIHQESKEIADLNKIKIQNGDYNLKELEKRTIKEDLILRQLEDMLLKTASRKKVAILCVSIAHAIKVREFLGQGVLYHSKQSKVENQLAKDIFENTDEKFMISVLALSEGYDFPEIDCLALFRPTRSFVLYVQAVGRIMRLHEKKKNALFLDYGNVIQNLGTIYNLQMDNAEPSTRRCSACGTHNGLNQPTCFHCGKVFLIPCAYCLVEKKVGEKCLNPDCVPEKRNVDRYKNLTTKSYEGQEYNKVMSFNAQKYISKNGNICIKMTYHLDNLTWVNEYLQKWNTINFENKLEDFSLIAIPKEVRTKINSKGYREIITKKF